MIAALYSLFPWGKWRRLDIVMPIKTTREMGAGYGVVYTEIIKLFQ